MHKVINISERPKPRTKCHIKFDLCNIALLSALSVYGGHFNGCEVIPRSFGLCFSND